MAELLGPYSSSLSQLHLNALLALAQAGVAQGDYSGGTSFNQAALTALAEKSKDFSSVPVPHAGDRAYADSLNYPLRLIVAAYQAVSDENRDFQSALARYLEVLTLDAEQIDRLLSAAELSAWTTTLPNLSGEQTFALDFVLTHGPENLTVDQTDPATGVVWKDLAGNRRILSQVSFDGVAGLGAPLAGDPVVSAPLHMEWIYNHANVQSNLASGSDWSSLSLLAPAPLMTVGEPHAEVLLPAGISASSVMRLKGSSNAGALPVLVRIRFMPRTNTVVMPGPLTSAVVQLSPYNISLDDLMVFDQQQSYFRQADFKADAAARSLTPLASMIGKTDVTCTFTEFHAGYQCSVNGLDWSPMVMFDPARPFADASSWFPLEVDNGWYPVVDELGKPFGIWMHPVSIFAQEYTLQISSAVVASGAQATLEVELAKPGFVNAVRINPFTSMPVTLKAVRAQGLDVVIDPTIVFAGNLSVDRPVSVRIANSDGSDVYATRLFLDFMQENYSLEQEATEAPDQLRKQGLATMQTIVPFSRRPVAGALPTIVTGAAYDFAINEIRAERWQFDAPGTVVLGPLRVTGSPAVLRLDAVSNQVDFWLMYAITDVGGSKHAVATASSTWSPGTALSFPDLIGTWPAIESVDFYLKCVLGQPASVLSRLAFKANTQ